MGTNLVLLSVTFSRDYDVSVFSIHLRNTCRCEVQILSSRVLSNTERIIIYKTIILHIPVVFCGCEIQSLVLKGGCSRPEY
jgi:hypothetical protein